MLFLLTFSFVWMYMAMFAGAAKLPSKPAQVKNLKATAYNTSSHNLTWSKVTGASGYQVYYRDCSSAGNLYKKIKTLKGASAVRCIIPGRARGRAYAYMVRAYKKNSAGVSYGKLSNIAYGFIKKTTPSSGNGSTAAGSSSGIIKNPTASQKYKKVFGNASLSMRYPGGYYTSKSKAEANMKTISVKTWDFKSGRSGAKITRTWTIRVHKNLASTVQQIFKEIYNDSSKFPIHELGGYDWRGGHSEHNTGTAIDINWTENYMVNIATGAITAGKYWRPGTDPYSIPKDGVVANIFKKYGFSQGDWGNSKDYMHFSYFGT